MHQQATSQSFQDFKPSTSSKSSNSSTSSSPSPSVTPLTASNHAVASLLNVQQATNFSDNIVNSYNFNQSLQTSSNTNSGTTSYSPALMAAIANMSATYNSQQTIAVTPNFPFYEFSNNFQQFMQHIDSSKKQLSIKDDGNSSSSEYIRKETNEDDTLPTILSCSSSSLYSSLNNTPVSVNSGLNRKRALSDVISKLRNNQQNDNKDDGSYDMEERYINIDSHNHEDQTEEQNESDLINYDEDGFEYSPSILLNLRVIFHKQI